MYLIYFDENKHSIENPNFIIGGFLVSIDNAKNLEEQLRDLHHQTFKNVIDNHERVEFHGVEIFQSKGLFKGRAMSDRARLFDDIASILINNGAIIRLVRIDVDRHKRKYRNPMPEYQWGLQVVLERFSQFLHDRNDVGVILGDYEKDEVTRSVGDFYRYKNAGTTLVGAGRSIGPLVDTIYYTHSHHSLMLQLADIVVYLAGRYENGCDHQNKFMDQQVGQTWNKIKANTDFHLKCLP